MITDDHNISLVWYVHYVTVTVIAIDDVYHVTLLMQNGFVNHCMVGGGTYNGVLHVSFEAVSTMVGISSYTDNYAICMVIQVVNATYVEHDLGTINDLDMVHVVIYAAPNGICLAYALRMCTIIVHHLKKILKSIGDVVTVIEVWDISVFYLLDVELVY